MRGHIPGKLALTPSIVLIRNWTGLLNLALSFKHYTLHFCFQPRLCTVHYCTSTAHVCSSPCHSTEARKNHERTASLRFLIINYLESSHTWGFRIQCLHYKLVLNHFCSREEGGKLLRLLSQLRPRIRLQVSKFKGDKNEISRNYPLTIPLKVDRMPAINTIHSKKCFKEIVLIACCLYNEVQYVIPI